MRLLLNAIEHGGRFSPDQQVHVTSARTLRAVVYMIRDPGEGFMPTALPHAALSNPDGTRHAEHRERVGMRPGGFGLLVARGLVDDVVHNERGNGVLLIKYLQPFSGPDAAVHQDAPRLSPTRATPRLPSVASDIQGHSSCSSSRPLRQT